MSKMSELSMLLDDLIECGNKLTKTAQALKDFYSDTAEPVTSEVPKAKAKATKKEAPANEPEATTEPATPTYKKEDVRAILSKKANEAGGQYKADVKALVNKYGNGGSLTDVDPSDYAALGAEIEALGNAG